MSNKNNQNRQIQKTVIASEAWQSTQYGFQLKAGQWDCRASLHSARNDGCGMMIFR